MKILYISFNVQHPKLPGSARQYHLMRELAKNHQVTLLTLCQKEISCDIVSDLSELAKRVLIVPLDSLYEPEKTASRWSKLAQHRQACSKMKSAVDDLLSKDHFDVILFHGKTVYKAIGHVKEVPIVADFCDASSLRISGEFARASLKRLPFLLWRYGKMRRTEKLLLRQTPYQAFISARDRQAIAGNDSPYEVVPNGVDLDFWRKSQEFSQDDGKTIVFTGVMSFKPNHDAALYLLQKIAPALRSHRQVNVWIVGKDPQNQLIELARGHEDNNVTGYVPDVRPYLQSASVFVAPIRAASGMQNKIIEAMAMQVPVVTSPNVAAGISIDGEELPVLVAKSKDEYIQHINALLSDVRLRQRMGVAGLRYVRTHFSWIKSANLLEQMAIDAKKDPRWQTKHIDREKLWSRKLDSPILSEK